MRWVVCFSVLCSHLGHFLGFASLINVYGRLLLDLRLPSHAPYPAPTYLPHLVYLPSSLCLLFESRAVQRKKKKALPRTLYTRRLRPKYFRSTTIMIQ